VIQRLATIVVLLGTTVAMACLDMSAPKGPASISILQLPSPSIVVGDVMRDSAGNPATLSVVGFDASGKPIPVDAAFIITDSIKFAHFDAVGLLKGDSLGTVHVLGQIGNVQTPLAAIPVTVAPTLIVSNQKPGDTLHEPITQDTTQHGTLTLSTTVTGESGANTIAAQGFIVHFSLLFAPATLPGKPPAVFFADPQTGKPTSVDTTDPSGVASRNVVIITPFVQGAADSVVVKAEATYKGAPIPGSPVRFVIPIKAGSISSVRR
jgi:hypothetical protein